MSSSESGGSDLSQADGQDSRTRDLSWDSDIVARLGPTGASRAIDQFHPIAPPQHPDFLASDEVVAQIVCGGRGMGKSTLLMYRVRHLKTLPGVRMVRNVPPFGFRLVSNSIPIPQKAFWHFSAIEPWGAAWKLVLGALFAFSIRRTVDQKLSANRLEDWLTAFDVDPQDAMFRELIHGVQKWGQTPHDECIADLMGTILNFRASTEVLTTLYRTKVKPILASRASTDANRWILFVDGIDEAISDCDSKENLLRSDAVKKYIDDGNVTSDNARVLAQEVWKCSQAGFARAAYQLSAETNSQVLAMGTIRSEALSAFIARSGLVPSKIEYFVLRIDYPTDFLREVFNYNVSLMSAKSHAKAAARPDGGVVSDDDSARAFVGYKNLYNRMVFGKLEDPYTLVRRHCFGTPRGLVMLGRKIRDVRVSPRTDGQSGNWRDPVDIISAVNSKAIDVLQEHLETLFPPWDVTYEQGFSHLKQNIILQKEAQDIERTFASNHHDKAPFFQYLFECGLVGVPATSFGTKVIQKFLTPCESAPESLPPDYEYLMLHPALSARVRAKLAAEHQQTFYSRRLLVNPGEECPVRLPQPLVKIVCRPHNLSGSISLCLFDPPVEIFGDASTVGAVFLATLALATRYYGGGFVDCDRLCFVAEKLAELGLVPDVIGTPKKSLTDFFKDACNNEKHGDTSNQPTAVSNAKGLLAKCRAGLKILPRLQSKGNAYALGWRASDASHADRQIDVHEIEVEGLSTAEFLVPTIITSRHRAPRPDLD